MTLPYYHELKSSQKYPRFNKVTWKFELCLLLGGKILQKVRQFVEVTWKFELPLLSRDEIFAKIRQFWWYHMKFELLLLSRGKIFAKIRHFFDVIWKFDLSLLSRAGVITSDNIVPMSSRTESSQKKDSFDDITWNLNCPYYDEVKLSQNKVVLLMWLESMASPFYH